MALVVAGAYWRGAAAERAVATVYLCAWLATIAVLQLTQRWGGPHVGLAVVDSAAALGLLVVALRSSKLWPSVAAGGQLSGVAIHVAYFVAPLIWSPAYFVALQITSSGVLAVLTYGVICAIRRVG